jgi:hypothetical protein
MTDQSNYYAILGMSTNNVIESVMLEGYSQDDAYYYIMLNAEAFEKTHPFIHKLTGNLNEIYKKQYGIDPNLSNFRSLIENSEELGNNFIRVIEYPHDEIINVCSYYQNNKKTVLLKPLAQSITQTLTLQKLTNELQSAKKDTTDVPTLSQPKTEIKQKIGLKKKA